MDKKKHNILKIGICVIVILLLLVFFCIAIAFSLREHRVQETDHSMAMITQWFTGTKEKKITVLEGEELQLSVDVLKTSGKLFLTITKQGESEPVYSGNTNADMDGIVYLKNPGTYDIKLKGKRFVGTYLLSWEPKR